MIEFVVAYYTFNYFCADSMVGDVNLFLGKDEASDPEKGLVAEIDIMIGGTVRK